VKPPSRRFTPTAWSERLVPILLVLMLLVLVAILVIIGMSSLGWLPS
jgi:hypothetical protein